MKAQDLRIGNIIHLDYKKEYINVYELSQTGCNGLKYNQFSGIQLTEEILLKCLLVKDVYRHNELLNSSPLEYDKLEERFCFYSINGCQYVLEKQDDWYYLGIKNAKNINYFVWDIKYLHQLQNLYFALTSKELGYTP